KLRDLSRHVGGNTTDDAEHEAEPAVGWRVSKAFQSNLAVGTERDSCVVLEREAHSAVRPRPERVRLEHDLPDLSGNGRAGPHDQHRTGDNLDTAGSSRLRRDWSGRRLRERDAVAEHECPGNDPTSSIH